MKATDRDRDERWITARNPLHFHPGASALRSVYLGNAGFGEGFGGEVFDDHTYYGW